MLKVGHTVWIQGRWRATVLAVYDEAIVCMVHEGTTSGESERATYAKFLVKEKKIIK